jgi:hypothetical protein
MARRSVMGEGLGAARLRTLFHEGELSRRGASASTASWPMSDARSTRSCFLNGGFLSRRPFVVVTSAPLGYPEAPGLARTSRQSPSSADDRQRPDDTFLGEKPRAALGECAKPAPSTLLRVGARVSGAWHEREHGAREQYEQWRGVGVGGLAGEGAAEALADRPEGEVDGD